MGEDDTPLCRGVFPLVSVRGIPAQLNARGMRLHSERKDTGNICRLLV